MSAPFRFGLERVREIRVHDEDQAKERFAASLNARVRGEAVLRAAEERLRQAQAGVTEPSLGPLTGATLDVLTSDPGTRALSKAMMLEAKAIGDKIGVNFRVDVERRINGAGAVGAH